MKQKLLQDVVIIRLMLIVLLVLYHAFAIYNQAWKMPDGVSSVPAYWWIASFAYSFMLEAFVFLSGYVYGYQVREKYNDTVSFKVTVLNKFKRLIVPSIVFSIIYILLFGNGQNISWGGQIYSIINGAGHMWFLPMLFWCFVLLYIIERLKCSKNFIFVLSILAALLCIIPLPLRLSSTAYYFIFFYVGYYIQKNDICVGSIMNWKSISLFVSLFLIVFLCSNVFVNSDRLISFSQESSLHKLCFVLIKNAAKLAYSGLGLICAFAIINSLLKKGALKVNQQMIRLSGFCFGVYIFQQFILKFIIYNESIVSAFGSYWLPWFSFVVALSESLLLSWLFVKSKVGKFLIG